MRKGDIVKFRKVVDVGDEDLRMILLEDPYGGRVLVEGVVDMKIRPTIPNIFFISHPLQASW